MVVVIGDRLDQLHPVLLGELAEVVRDRHRLPTRAELVEVDDRVHLYEVDDAAEFGLSADRQLEGDRIGAEPVDHHLEAAEEVGADAIHLVDVADPWDAVLVGLSPDGLGLRLDAANGAEQGDRAVQDAQASLYLDGEIHVAGCVDDVDARVTPVAGGRRRGDRDATLLLLRHPVHHGRAFVDLAHLVSAPRVVQDALRGRGLAGVDVRHDADVACALERELSHAFSSIQNEAPETRRGLRLIAGVDVYQR